MTIADVPRRLALGRRTYFDPPEDFVEKPVELTNDPPTVLTLRDAVVTRRLWSIPRGETTLRRPATVTGPSTTPAATS